MEVLEVLRKRWRNAKESWEILARNFDLASVTFSGTKRFLYVPDGRKHFPLDTGKQYARGWVSPREVWQAAQDGLLDPDKKGLYLVESGPVLEGVVSTLAQISGSRIRDLEGALDMRAFD